MAASSFENLDETPDPLDVRLGSPASLDQAIRKQTELLGGWIRMQQQFMLRGEGGGGEGLGQAAMAMQYRPRMQEELLKSLTAHGQIPTDPTMGMTKMTGWGALTSLQNAQAYAAQWLGQKIAQRGIEGTPAGFRYTRDTGFKLYPEEEKGRHGAVTPDEVQTTPDQPDVRVQRQRPSGPAAGQPYGQYILSGGVGPVAQPRAEEEKIDQDLQSVASSEKSVAASLKSIAKEGLGRAMGAVGEAIAGAGEKMAPEAPHIPAPAGDTTPAPPTPQAGSGGPSGPPGGPGGGGGGGGPGGGGGGGGPGGGGGGPGTPGGGGQQGPPTIPQQIGARIAMTGGTTGGVLGLLKRIPGVGLVIDAGEAGAKFYTGQREAGRAFQEVEGTSNWAGQMERISSLRYQVGMFGRVPEGVAARMFGAVTEMGLNNAAIGQGAQLQNRTTGLQFMYHNYLSTGTSMEQSAQILSTATQNATVSLTTVADALDSVSKSAGEAGTNAKNARDNFNNYFNTVLQGAGAGPNAATLAGGIAGMQASYGNAFARTNMGGITGPTEQYMLSGQTGMSPNQIQALQRTNPGGYAQLYSGSVMQFIQRLPGMTPAMITDMQSMIQAMGGPAAVQAQPDLAAQVAQQFEDKYQASVVGMDLNVWAQLMQVYSQTPLTQGNVVQFIVEQVAGNNLAANTQGGATGKPVGAPVAAGQAGQVGPGKTGQTAGGAPTGQYGLAQPVAPQVAGRYGVPGKSWQQVLQGGAQGAAAQQYLGQEQKTGQRSPVLEALLQNVPANAKVAVHTASGVQVVSFADAMKYYPDELEAGQATFYDSNGKIIGATGTLTHGLTDPTAEAGATQEAGQALPQGVSATGIGSYLKQHPQQSVTKSAASGQQTTVGGVTVDLSDAAKQLLKLLPTNSDNAAASGTVPQNPYVSQASR